MDYRRMGNMELDLGNTTSSHHLRDLWGSPRWTVIRIQALALLSIILGFFLAIFGSCRRWSNRWIIQKGFFVAQVLSLSLGTYSIGLMQSSSAKSEMYPIWTVSLFTLSGCIDPVSDYISLDYKGPLSKVVYGVCLNFGYVLLMTISTISSAVGNTSIGMLSAITFIKGFHRSLALMQQRIIQNGVLKLETLKLQYATDESSATPTEWILDNVTLLEKEEVLEKHEGVHQRGLRSCYAVCAAYALSLDLRRHFVGVANAVTPHAKDHLQDIVREFGGYKWLLEVIETELAFMFEVFFTSNEFLHYYQAKAASVWALASFMGICFVGVAAAIPGAMTSSHGNRGSTNVVDTTTADRVITFGILVSLALLQLLHLVRCWTSNWAKVAVACRYVSQKKREGVGLVKHRGCWWKWWMSLKTIVATSTNWFDRYLWQDQIGQHSASLATPDDTRCAEIRRWTINFIHACDGILWRMKKLSKITVKLYRGGRRLAKMLGLDYIREVLWDLLGSDTNKGTTVRLEDDVKASITEFIGQIESCNRLEGSWLSFSDNYPSIKGFLPYCKDPKHESYTTCVMLWHVATEYCQQVEEFYGTRAGAAENGSRRVASALSKYCAYLLGSAPELLPGLAPYTKHRYSVFVGQLRRWRKQRYRRRRPPQEDEDDVNQPEEFSDGVILGNLLLGVPENYRSIEIFESSYGDVTRLSDPWETLALVWVRLLVYAAPYGNVEAHMRHLAQGGELITHLWALLFHLGIREWKHPEEEEDIRNIIRRKEEKEHLQNITTMDDAKMIAMDELAVVAFVGSLSGPPSDELAAASNLEDGVRFYQTSNPDVARHFHIDPEVRDPALILLNKEAKEKFTLYDGSFRAYDIAYFVTSNKLAFAKTRAQGTDPSSADNPIKKQSSEDGLTARDCERELRGPSS